MKTIARLGCLAVGATAATGLLAGPANAADRHHGARGDAHAVFVQTDETNGNHVAAYRQHSDGSLSLAHSYATGGTGGVLPNSVIDHTASQGGVTYDAAHKLLYVVNAGSNTLSVFSVHGARLDLRQVIASGGRFPVSVAVHGDTVYVLNAQEGGSIQGYAISGRTLFRIPTWRRTLGLDATLTNFTQTPGQVAFSPRGNQLLVTTKANTNSVDVFNLAVPFAIAFDEHGRVLVADAGPAAVTTLDLHPNGTLTATSTVVTGQGGTCWVIRDGRFLFTTNPGGSSVSTLTLHNGAAPTVTAATTTDAGTVDPAVSYDGRFLYVETGANGIVDEFRVNGDGSLTEIGTTVVANAAGAEGIATS
jgi:DNA-binding beta-propeller fold protein YncE